MSNNVLVFQSDTAPVVVGAGLIALDVVLDERTDTPPRLWAGGTCGNVLSILAFLGWRSLPVSRLARDAASRLIIRDLKRWGVDRRVCLHRAGEAGTNHRASNSREFCGRAVPQLFPQLSRLRAPPAVLPARPSIVS